jgi:hypothetical protein
VNGFIGLKGIGWLWGIDKILAKAALRSICPALKGLELHRGYSRWVTRIPCYTVFVSSTNRLRNVTVTLEEDVAQWARIEAARRDTSVSRLLGALLKERMSAHDGSAVEAAERLASFGTRHKLSLRGLKVKDLINEGRR